MIMVSKIKGRAANKEETINLNPSTLLIVLKGLITRRDLKEETLMLED